MSLTRSATGLLLADDFASLSAWTLGTAEWTADTTRPCYLAWPSARALLQPGAVGTTNGGGCREPLAIVAASGGRYHFFFDSGNGDSGTSDGPWDAFYAYSDDQGVTVTVVGRVSDMTTGAPSGISTYNVAGKVFYNSTAGKWIFCVLLAEAVTGNIPSIDYRSGIYTADDIGGPYTFIRESPALGGSGAFDEASSYIGEVIEDPDTPGTWHAYYSARLLSPIGDAQGWSLGHATASDPRGPWTKDGNTDTTVHPDLNNITDGCQPENPKAWYSSTLAKWVMFVNSVKYDGTYTDGNDTLYAADFDDWRLSTAYRVRNQWVNSLDSLRAIGFPSPFSNEDGTVIEETDGAVGFIYDRNPPATFNGSSNAPGYHEGRELGVGQLEPSVGSFLFTATTPGTDAPSYARQALSHTDLVAEFTLEFLATGTTSDIGFWFRRDSASADASANGYLVNWRAGNATLRLYKCVSGTFTELTTGTRDNRTALSTKNLQHERVRISVVGTAITVVIDGTTVISTTDSTFSSGTHVAWRGTGAIVRGRKFHCRSGNTLTVNGCGAAAAVSLLGAGGHVIDTATANGSGVATFTLTHGPAYGVAVAGTVHQLAGDPRLWNDTVTVVPATGSRMALLGVGT